MKKGVVVFLHVGYWILYGLLLLLIGSIIKSGIDLANNRPARIGIGTVQQDTGLKVLSILPGGPADRQGELKVGDEIIKLKEDGRSDTFYVSRMPREESSALIYGRNGSEIHLTVKRGEKLQHISIIRETIKEEFGPTVLRWFELMLGFGIVPGFLAFYSFYTFLFTRFLSQRKIVSFILVGLLVCMLTVIPGEMILYLGKFGNEKWMWSAFLGLGVIIFINALLNGVLGLVIRGFVSWYADIKLKEELNRKNYETELALVKSQLNPHFLFNTINNIDVLIMKDQVKASDYLNKLSDIMRFMLYETKSEKIPLVKELEYIEKYIELQKIRTANPNFILYKTEGDPLGISIEPMLFIPFIENAFKHSENKKVENGVSISIRIRKQEIEFECRNNYADSAQVEPSYGGLGQGLISKRLELLYPGKHVLDIQNENGMYAVKLVISI